MLIIEDDPNTLTGLVLLLQAEGFEVLGVVNGAEALEVMYDTRIDIVLCDYTLPDLNGIQVSLRLKDQYPELVIFLVTANYDMKMFSRAKRCGVDKIFTKPIVFDDLVNSCTNFYSSH